MPNILLMCCQLIEDMQQPHTHTHMRVYVSSSPLSLQMHLAIVLRFTKKKEKKTFNGSEIDIHKLHSNDAATIFPNGRAGYGMRGVVNERAIGWGQLKHADSLENAVECRADCWAAEC